MGRSLFLENKNDLQISNKTPDTFVSDAGDLYTWIWITAADPDRVLALRNAKNVLEKVRDAEPISFEAHGKFISTYSQRNRVDFVCIHHLSGDYIGSVNINRTQHGYELGKYIGNKDYLGKHLALPMTKSFLIYVSNYFKPPPTIVAVTRTDNDKNIRLNKKLGFKIVGIVDSMYYLMKK